MRVYELELIPNEKHFAIPLASLGDRLDKRKAKREVSDAIAKLMPIESDFIACIFDPSIDKSYKELFDYHNAIFYNTAKTLRNYDMIAIDAYYFFNKYVPIN